MLTRRLGPASPRLSLTHVAKIRKLDWGSYASRRVITRHVHHHTNTPISRTLTVTHREADCLTLLSFSIKLVCMTVTHRRRKRHLLRDVVSRRLHAPHLSASLLSPRHPARYQDHANPPLTPRHYLTRWYCRQADHAASRNLRTRPSSKGKAA